MEDVVLSVGAFNNQVSARRKAHVIACGSVCEGKIFNDERSPLSMATFGFEVEEQLPHFDRLLKRYFGVAQDIVMKSRYRGEGVRLFTSGRP